VVQLAGEDGQRILVEDGQQLLVAEPEERLEMPGLTQKSWFSSRCDGSYRRVSGSVAFAGGTAIPGTLAVMPGAGDFGTVR